MLFTPKNRGFFVDISEHTIAIARASSTIAPLVVEDLKFLSRPYDEKLPELLEEMQPKRAGGGNYLHGSVGVYSPKRLIGKAPIEAKKCREEAYLNELISTQFRVDPHEYTIAVLSPSTGLDLDRENPTDKEALFVGMLNSEIVGLQKDVLQKGIYPERLEMGTAATLGALSDYLAFTNSRAPTLVLEIGDDFTYSFILGEGGLAIARFIPQGLSGMVPVVQKELGLKDEESAKKLFYSNTFDFTGMASSLTKKLLKELQSSIGFYEVKTGQSIGQVLCTLLPDKLGWLSSTISSQLGVEAMTIEYGPWLKARQITFAKSDMVAALDGRAIGVLSLMLNHTHVARSKEKQ